MRTDLLSRILVPLDGSSHAEAILSHLRRILPLREVELILFHAASVAPWAGAEDAERYLRRVAYQLMIDGFPARSLIRKGPAAGAILDAALRESASLIALTTHGRAGAARFVLGSVAEHILQASPLPVLVSRSIPHSQCRGKLESLPVRNFIVPLDGSREALGALEPVLSLARPVDAHVTLLHVDEPSPYEGRWEPPGESLKEADLKLREACIPSTIEHRKGAPGKEILKAAREKKADLIAMTTHGRSGPSRWFFGSVTAEVLRRAEIPLLVVRHPVRAGAAATRVLKDAAP